MATIKNRPIARTHWTYDAGLAIYEIDSNEDRALVGFFGGTSKPSATWHDIVTGPDGGSYILYKGESVDLDDFLVCN